MKQKRNRHWRGPGPQPRKMFSAGSKAWARRLKGDVRRARIRALRIAERQLRPHGWRVESARKAPLVPEQVVSVYAVPPPRAFGSADDVLSGAMLYRPMIWTWNEGLLETRHGMRCDLRERCSLASRRHFPGCDCDDCLAVPF